MGEPGDDSQVHELARAFQDAWPAEIDEFLVRAGSARREAVVKLCNIDLELRWRHHREGRAEDYFRRYPEEWAASPDEALALRAAEYELRREHDRPDDCCEEDGVSTSRHSHEGTDTGPDDPDATLTYSVGRDGGRVVPWIDDEQQRRLHDAFAPGGVLQGRYRIDRELGRGGMGIVFLGRDLQLDRPVAIKVILLQGRASAGDETHLQALRGAFAEEARLGANLTHPAIATVYDYGFHDDKPFTVFEYLPGEALRDLLRRRGRLPLEEVRLIIGPLAQALDFAHSRRVVHRDLKPDNVRATEQGLFKVLDLGLAREFGRDLDWSGFAGTPAYASPEQASGLPCDGRADQYALALIAFELLTGGRLFRASDPEDLLEMHREAEPAALATDLADAPEVVRLALARALSKAPNARFPACGDFAVALGCQLLSSPAPAPEILMEADVERMTVGRFTRWVSIPGFRNAVHLTMTREAIWSAYHTEVRRWPLAAVERIEPVGESEEAREVRAATFRRLHRESEEAMAAAVRRLHRDAEAVILLGSWLHVFVFWFVVLTLTVLVGLAVFGGPGARTRSDFIAIGVLTTLGAWLFAVNRGLRQLRPWAQWVAFTEAIVLSMMAAVSLILLLTTPPPSGSLNHLVELLRLGLLLITVIALVAYTAYNLLPRKASDLFTPSHRAVVDRPPYRAPRTTHRLYGPVRKSVPSESGRGINPVSQPLWERILHFWSVLAGASQRTLRLTLRVPDDRQSRVAFRFPTAEECEHWAGRLATLAGRPTDPAAPGGEAAPAEPTLVVLLRHRPTERYQLLGTVEAKADRRPSAEASLQVRAAMIGADAVVDLQEEFLPDYRRTVRRLTGTAVRAVDAEGRFEFRSRWYADRVAWVSTWSFVLMLINLSWMVLNSILFVVTGAIVTMVPVSLKAAILFIAAIHIWPIGLAALARGLHWPQFVRPLALAVVAIALYNVFALTGLVAGTLLSRNLWAVFYISLVFLDPMNLLVIFPLSLSILVFGLLLGRTAWRADREFRRLVPDAARKAPPHRALGGGLALTASITYAALLAFSSIGGGYQFASLIRFPNAVNQRAAAAMAQFQAGAALLESDPAQSEGLSRKAISLWEDLVRKVPSELDYQINLEAARMNLATAALRQGRVAEALEQLTGSAARWESLGSGPLSASQRALVDKNRNIVRISRKVAVALAQFQAGAVAFLQFDPARAEGLSRGVIPLWQDLVREVPSELDYQIKLEAARTNLAIAVWVQGRVAEAMEQFTRSAARWESLASGPLPPSQRASVDTYRNLVRTSLSSIKSAPGMGQGQAPPFMKTQPGMKCQKCVKTATFHIHDIEQGKPREYHLCDEHARQHLTPHKPGE